jgi:hypothetical protein
MFAENSVERTTRPTMDSPPLKALRDRLFAQIDIGWLVFFRIAFGGIMLWEVWRYFDKERIFRYYIQPHFHFTYYGFGWIHPWQGEGMYHHFYAMGFLAICILVGFCYRIAAALFFVAFTYVFLLDQSYYLNHFYLISLVSGLLIFIPAHRALSIDALMRPSLRSSTAPAWTLWLLRWQIGIAYFFGGIAKIGHDWLAGEPMRMWLADRTDFPVIGRFFHEEWMVYFFVLGGLFLDLLVVPALLWRRTRLPALAAAVAFHLLNSRLFSIGIFPWFMLCATLIFFPPDLPRRIWRWIIRRPLAKAPESGIPPPAGPWTRHQAIVASLLAAFAAFHVLMPLRHLLYPGNVDWTEEGHRFSWHMKLRAKDSEAVFLVTDVANGAVMEVYPGEYLAERQAGKMSTRPDMIIQFAHYLVEQMRLQGFPKVEVRAQVFCSLNGREPQFLVDPNVDLAQMPRTLGHASWIMPLTEPLTRQSPDPRHHQAEEDDFDGR